MDEELLPELIDPITLSLMEDPVMLTSCGHSFSAESIAAWVREPAQASKGCPVCDNAINPHQPPVPNWALRNTIHRYREKHGKQMPIDSAAQVKINLVPGENEPLLKPGSGPLPAVEPRLASSKPSSSKRPKTREVPSPARATINAEADRNDGGCECCAGLPTGRHRCCVWECDKCGVCRMAEDCKGLDCWLRFPLTTLTCQVSFGERSNWCTRTLCGLIYPLWVMLVLGLAVCDQLIMIVGWSLWVLGVLFFKLTRYFCPSFNRWVYAKLGRAAFYSGLFDVHQVE